MARRKSARILPVVLVLIAVAIAIAVLISLARMLLVPGDKGADKKPESSLTMDSKGATSALLDTSADRSVSLVASGPIVAQENYRSYQLTIGPSERKLVLYEGYLDTVVDTLTLDNNVSAYTQFVNALNDAGLTKDAPLVNADDGRFGVCAKGEFYQFDLLKDYSKDLVGRYRTSTCSKSIGNARQIIDLFVVQIPDAKSILKNVNVYSS